jgi:hypothetical protein
MPSPVSSQKKRGSHYRKRYHKPLHR